MVKLALLASTAVGLLLCAAQANAQVQQKGGEERASPTQPQGSQAQPGKGSEPAGKGASKAETKEPGKGTAQTEEPKGGAGQAGKEKSGKGTAERPEPKGKGSAEKAPEPGKGTKGTAEKGPEPGRGTKGTAEKAPESGKGTKGTAEKGPEPGKGTKGAGTERGSEGARTKGAGTESKEPGTSGRVQLSEQKRADVGQTLAKERSLNRATNVHVQVNIGTRLPRSVHLAAVPASIVAIVPEYRSYRYVVVEDQVCIVEPRSLEIVEVIPLSGHRTARGAPAERLVLTEEERAIILREVEMDGGSTLGLGAIAEGASVPRDVKLRTFPDTVVERVPKVRGYRYFASENRVAVVDPQGGKVQLVIEDRR